MKKLLIDDWNKWIDFTSGGIFAAILGADWRPKINASAACYGAHYDNPITLRYIDRLKEVTGFESVVLYSTGSEATEAYWRAMRVYTGKPGVWGGLIDPDQVGADKTQCDAMHGMTLGAQIMAGRLTWAEMGIAPELGAGRFGTAHEMTSCMIMEPYHAPSAQFHRQSPTIERVMELQAKFPDIPLCVDEVQGGFGRTGKFWAHEWYDGLKPDFVTCGKGMGGGYPLAALLGPKEILEDPRVIESAHLHSTHSGHPAMCAIGLQVLDRIEKDNLVNESRRKGEVLAAGLRGCGLRVHAGNGLLAGIECKDAGQAERVVLACRERGLLVVGTGRKWVKIGPPLTITYEALDEGIGKLRAAIEEVLDGDVETCGDTGAGLENGDADVPTDGIHADRAGGDAAGPEDAG